MKTSSLLSRLGLVIPLPLGLLLAAFFFVPWLDITCNANGATIATMSGLQLSVGGMTRDMQQMPPLPGGPDGESGANSSDQFLQDPQARPWFFLSLLVPLAVLVVAGVGLAGNFSLTKVGAALAILSLAGLALLILAAYTDVTKLMAGPGLPVPPVKASDGSQDAQAAMQGMAQTAVAGMIKAKVSGFLIWSIVLYAVMLVCGVLCMLHSRFGPRSDISDIDDATKVAEILASTV